MFITLLLRYSIGKNTGKTMKPADPSPKEIAERGLEIQSAWTPDERQRRLRADWRPMALAERKMLDPDFVLAVIEPLKQEAAEADTGTER